MRKLLTLLILVTSLTGFGQGRYFTRASSQGYRTSTAPVTFYPITLAAWVKCNSFSGNGTAISVCHTTSGNRTQLLFQTTGTFQTQAGPSALYVPTAATVSTGVWYHILATVTIAGSTISVAQYTNGVATGVAASGTDAGTDPLWNVFAVGERHNGTSWGTYWDGDIYDACVWSAALDANEIASLANGCSPAMIRPASLRGWMRLGETPIEKAGGLTLTVDGTPTISQSGPPKIWGFR